MCGHRAADADEGDLCGHMHQQILNELIGSLTSVVNRLRDARKLHEDDKQRASDAGRLLEREPCEDHARQLAWHTQRANDSRVAASLLVAEYQSGKRQ